MWIDDPKELIPWLTLLISMGTACLAGLAWWLTRQKLRLDLYDRRFGVYVAALEFSELLSGWSNSAEQQQVRRNFWLRMNESQFLFSEKSGVFNTLVEINREAFKRIVRDNLVEQLPELDLQQKHSKL